MADGNNHNDPTPYEYSCFAYNMATTCDGIFFNLPLLDDVYNGGPSGSGSILQSFFGFRTETLKDIHEGNLGARGAVLPYSSF